MSNAEPTGHIPADDELPQTWTLASIGELVESVRNGITYKNAPDSGGIPISRIQSISHGVIDFTSVGFAGLEEIDEKHLLQPGDILLSHINSISHLGKVAIYRDGYPPLAHGMNLLKLRCSDRILAKYFFLNLQNSETRAQIWDRAQHAVNQASINIKQLKEVSVPVPPLAEQERIVEILEEQLSRLDAALESIRVVREKAAQFRRSLLHAAFTGTLTGHNPADGQLPEGWSIAELGAVADVGWGDLQVTKSSYVENGFVAYSATGPDGFRPTYDFDQVGIVLSAIGAACGKTWLASGKWSCIKNTMRILPASDAVGIRFLHQQLSDPLAWPKRGTGQPFISQKDARELLVSIPSRAEQERIVEILEEQLSRLDAALVIADAIEKRSAALRRSLLHAAFTGRLTEQWRELSHV